MLTVYPVEAQLCTEVHASIEPKKEEMCLTHKQADTQMCFLSADDEY